MPIKRPLAGKILAGIGVFVVLLDIGLRVVSWWTKRPYDVDHNIILPGVIMGFIGFYIIDSTKTKDATSVITDLLPRFGRRKTDAIAQPGTITTTKVEHPEAKDVRD